MRKLLPVVVVLLLSPASWAHTTDPVQGGLMTITYGGTPGKISVVRAAGEPCTVTAEAVEIVVTTPLLTIQSTVQQPALDVFLSVTASRHPVNGSETTAVRLSWRATGFHADGAPDPECNGAADVLFNVTVVEPPSRENSSANKPLAPIAGDPVNASTGELVGAAVPDLSLGGAMPLTFMRYYGSLLTSDGNVDSKLGSNWSHNFSSRLRIDDANNVSVISWRGRVIPFTKSGSSWTPGRTLDVPYQLVQSGGGFIFGDPVRERVDTFDANGRLVKIEDTHGNVHTLTYNGTSLASVSDGIGRTISFTYDGSGRIASIGDGTRTVLFSYSGGNLSSVTDAAGFATTYTYDSSGRLLTTREPEGAARYSQTYDASGRVNTQVSATGGSWSLSYASGRATLTDPTGKNSSQQFASSAGSEMTAATDAAGRTATFGSDAAGRRSSVTDRLGDTTSSTADGTSGKIADFTRADGTRVNFTYATLNFNGIILHPLTQIRWPDNTTEVFTYDGSGNLLSRADRAAKVWQMTYNGRGQPLTITNPTGGIRTFTYNADGTLATSEDSDTGRTTFAYDNLRRLITVTRPDNSKTTLTYDANNRVTSFTDENGNVYSYSYDKNGNLIAATDPAGNRRQYAYDALDHMRQMTDTLGHVTNFAFNNLDLLSAITDANGNSISIAYDALQHVSSISDGAGKTWTLERDEEGVPTAARSPLGKIRGAANDKLGRTVSASDAAGAATSVVRDSMGRATTVSDPLSRATSASYDARGHISSVTSPAGVNFTFGRDDAGRLTRFTDGERGTWNFSYTPSGRPKSATDPVGRTQTLTYDARGRVSRVDLPGGTSAQMTHDRAGNLTRIAFSDGPDLTYGFDALNRLTTAGAVTISRDSEGRITGMNQSGTNFGVTYDAGGQVASLSYDNGAMIVSYSYDARNLVTRVSDNLSNAFVMLDYDNAARLTGIRRSNGVNATYTLDANGRITAIRDGAFFNVQLTRNAAGELVNETGTFPLDPAVAAGNDAQTFAYDASGQPTGPSVSLDIRGRPSWSSTPTSYDGGSRLTRAGAMQFTWNALDQMSSRIETAGTTMLFYDRRFLAAENTGANARYYVHTPSGLPLYFVDGGTKSATFYHFDQDGSTVALSNSSGQTSDTYAYDPHGVLLGHDGLTQHPFQFLGAFNVFTQGPLLFGGKHAFDPLSGAAAGPPQLPSVWRNEPVTQNAQTVLRDDHVLYGKPFDDNDPQRFEDEPPLYDKDDPPDPVGGRETVTAKPPVPATGTPLLGTPPLVGTPSLSSGLPADIAAVTASSVTTVTKKPKIVTGSVLIITQSDVDAEMFRKQRDYFKKELEKHGITVFTIDAGTTIALKDDPNANIGLTAQQLKSVTGVVTVGHSEPTVLAGYISPNAMNALLDRTGPLQVAALWGCNSFGFYENYTNLFYTHAQKGGPVAFFGFSSFGSPSFDQHGFAKGLFQSDPFVEFLDGTRGGGEYSIFDFKGWFWGKIFGGS